MYIRGHGKMGYLIGEINAQESADPAYATGDVENSEIWKYFYNNFMYAWANSKKISNLKWFYMHQLAKCLF